MRLENVYFIENGATFGAGGIFSLQSSLELTNVHFIGNFGSSGGGLYASADFECGNYTFNVTMRDCSFVNNVSDYTGGGMSVNGEYVHDAKLTLINTEFIGNKASTGGGGLWSENCLLDCVNVSWIGNSTSENGGGLNDSTIEWVSDSGEAETSADGGAKCTLTNVLFAGNYAGMNGGGGWFARDASVNNATINGNRAGGQGGGLYMNEGALLTNNSTFWVNSAASDANIAFSETQYALASEYDHCLIQGSGGSGIQWNAAFGQDLGGNLDGDPKFAVPVDPALAPATEGDLRLISGSPALAAGNIDKLPADAFDLDQDGDVIEPLPIDLDGNTRVLGNGLDLGAYERITDCAAWPAHSADVNCDGVLSLSELLRVIQIFNSDGYACADSPGDTEDGFLPKAGENHACDPHSSDYNPQDWQVDLSELLRLIQLFNAGGYTYCPDDNTEDGFCPKS